MFRISMKSKFLWGRLLLFFVLLTLFPTQVKADDGVDIFIPLFVIIIFIAVCCSICKKCCQESLRKQIAQSQGQVVTGPSQQIYPTQPTYGYTHVAPNQQQHQPYVHPPPPLPTASPPPYYQMPYPPPQPGFDPAFGVPSAPPPPYSEK